MLSLGRPEDQVFSGSELLYRRYLSEHVVDGKIVDACFPFPSLSVNRSKYSEPQDVLFSEDGSYDVFGVLEFRVEPILVPVPDDSGTRFFFFPWHVPLERNYSHSEVWCERGEARGQKATPSRTARKKIRAIICQHASVRLEAKH